MRNMAKKTMALFLSLCTLFMIVPMNAQAYSFSESAGALTVSYKSELVVPKGESVNLSVKAETSDGHSISYQWSEMTETDQTDKDGYTIWKVYKLKGATGASYTVPSVTEDKSYECEVWCDDNSYTAVYQDIYAADILMLGEPVTSSKTTDKYQQKYFVFTPSQSGSYVFLSSGDAEARLSVFDDLEVNSNNLISDYESNDSGTGGSALVELKSGHTYAIQAYLGASANGSYSVSVQQYEQTDFSITSKQTSYNVDKKSASTTMKVSSSTKGSSAKQITYQWYQYDPIEWDYVPIDGANQASYTVANSSLQWIENDFRCDATNQFGESDSRYFKLYNDSDWCAYSDDSDERVAYNSQASLSVLTGQMHDIYNEYDEWISEEFVEDNAGKTYQWYKLEYDSSYYDGDRFVEIPNQTSADYKTGAVTENSRYLCVVKDSSGICDYRQYYVRPALMDVKVDKTYYPVKDGGDVSVKITATAKESYTTFDYYWYKGTASEQSDGSGYVSMDYAVIDKYQGKSTVRLTDITETQYLKCEVWAKTKKGGTTISDYVEINFVVDPGTGYYQMYTTSDDKNVKGASVMANSETTKNSDGTYTTVTTAPDGSKSESVTEKNSDGSKNVMVTSSEVNSAGKRVKVIVTTTLNADGEVTVITEESIIEKAASNTSADITVRKTPDGKVTETAASVTTASKNKKAVITSELLDQIKEAVGKKVKDVDVTMTVTDNKGKTKYTVLFNTGAITSGNTLYLFKYDAKSDSCTAVNDKKYTVDKDGSITVSASTNITYLLAENEQDALNLLGEIRIEDEETPLAAGEDNCYVHWIILLLVLAAGIYNVVRTYTRRHSRAKEENSQEA